MRRVRVVLRHSVTLSWGHDAQASQHCFVQSRLSVPGTERWEDMHSNPLTQPQALKYAKLLLEVKPDEVLFDSGERTL